MINREKLEFLIESFNEKKNHHLSSFPPSQIALESFEYDMMLKPTTNKDQLEKIGIDCSNVLENINEIIEGLRLIGIKLIFKNMPRKNISTIVEKVINEVVPDIWRGDSMSEFIDLDPKGQFLSDADRLLKEELNKLLGTKTAVFSTASQAELIDRLVEALCDNRTDI